MTGEHFVGAQGDKQAHRDAHDHEQVAGQQGRGSQDAEVARTSARGKKAPRRNSSRGSRPPTSSLSQVTMMHTTSTMVTAGGRCAAASLPGA